MHNDFHSYCRTIVYNATLFIQYTDTGTSNDRWPRCQKRDYTVWTDLKGTDSCEGKQNQQSTQKQSDRRQDREHIEN